MKTNLFNAVKTGKLGHVRRLVEMQGADKDKGDSGGCTPLWWASFNGHLKLAQYLVERGATLDKASETGRSPLSAAAGKGTSTSSSSGEVVASSSSSSGSGGSNTTNSTAAASFAAAVGGAGAAAAGSSGSGSGGDKYSGSSAFQALAYEKVPPLRLGHIYSPFGRTN